MAAEKGGAGSNLFPVLRLLLPKLDKERGAYNLKVLSTDIYTCVIESFDIKGYVFKPLQWAM